MEGFFYTTFDLLYVAVDILAADSTMIESNYDRE